MQIPALIDTALGLVLFYLVLSLICTAVTELIATVFRMRANTLRASLGNIFGQTNLLESFYQFPLVQGLFKGTRGPAAIPTGTFATAVVHLVSGQTAPSMDSIRNGIAGLPDSPVKSGLEVLFADASSDMEKLKASLGAWFDSVMDRVSGWYKRKAQWITLVVALVVAGAINADTVQIVRTLSQDPALRAELAKKAVESAAPGTTATLDNLAEIDKNLTDLGTFGLPMGWTKPPVGTGNWFLKAAGLLLTIFAMSLGAPFWFDLLKQLSSLKSSMSGSQGAQPGSGTSQPGGGT